LGSRRFTRSKYDVPVALTADALIGVAIDWLQHDCPQTSDEMATLTVPLFTAIYDTQARPPSSG
jgi:hypothetical protein